MSIDNYEIRPIDLSEESNCNAVQELINEVFELNISNQKIKLNTNTRNNKTVILGVYKGENLAAMNAFIAHELQLKNDSLIAYQSCWSATSKHHRKRGLFSSLINFAKENLDGAFIFGFPNKNSEPIFIKKLGFRKVPMSKVNIPVKLASGFFLNQFLKPVSSTYQFDCKNAFLPLEAELIDLKKGEYADDIRVYGSYNNLIWGKSELRKSKLGQLKFFHIGGIQVNKPNLLPLVFKEVIEKEKADILQYVASSNSSIWDLFKRKFAADQTEPLIVYDLKVDSNNKNLNFGLGIKDVF